MAPSTTRQRLAAEAGRCASVARQRPRATAASGSAIGDGHSARLFSLVRRSPRRAAAVLESGASDFAHWSELRANPAAAAWRLRLDHDKFVEATRAVLRGMAPPQSKRKRLAAEASRAAADVRQRPRATAASEIVTAMARTCFFWCAVLRARYAAARTRT